MSAPRAARGGQRRILGFLLFCALVIVARVTTSAAVDLRAAQGHESAGRSHEAAVRYGDAIRMYLPGLPTGRRASDRLVALAQAAAARGDQDEARFCWEELRSSWLSVRSTWQPGAVWVELAQARIAELILRDPRGNWPDRSLRAEERVAVVQAALERRDDPALPWVLAMGLGYLLWLAGASLAIWRGLSADDDGPTHWPSVLRFGAMSIAGYGLFLLALARA